MNNLNTGKCFHKRYEKYRNLMKQFVLFGFGLHSTYHVFFTRHVILPNDLARQVPKSHLMTETEWRNLGVQQSPGWVHYMLHAPEPHVLLFRRPLPQPSESNAAAAGTATTSSSAALTTVAATSSS